MILFVIRGVNCFCKVFKATQSITYPKTFNVLNLFYLRFLMLHLEIQVKSYL